MLTCVGTMTVYVDDVKLNEKTSSFKTVQNSTIPTGSSVLGIHCHKLNSQPKILGAIGVSIVTTSNGWMCTDQYHPEWNSTKFANTSWAPAVAYGRNELDTLPYGKVENISNTAEWIGTKKNGADSLYCRFSLCPERGNVLQRFASKHKPQTFSRVCLRLKRRICNFKRRVCRWKRACVIEVRTRLLF